jgi:hypothetical protein
MHRAARRHAATGLAAMAIAAMLCGCGTVASERTAASASPSPSASVVDTATAVPTASATRSPGPTSPSHPTAPPPAAPSSRKVSEADDRGTVTLRAGGTLSVVLHSTYWQYDPPSDPSVLRSQADPTYSPDPPGSCVPGGGCGTLTAGFRALRPGRAVITAHRTSCGEAMACVGDAGRFSVTVVVSD